MQTTFFFIANSFFSRGGSAHIFLQPPSPIRLCLVKPEPRRCVASLVSAEVRASLLAAMGRVRGGGTLAAALLAPLPPLPPDSLQPSLDLLHRHRSIDSTAAEIILYSGRIDSTFLSPPHDLVAAVVRSSHPSATL